MPGTDEAGLSLQGLRILLVEDDPLICLDLEASLSDLGAIVMATSNVASAMKIMAVSTLDFAVLDFELGVETSEPIAQIARTQRVPFLYLSGYSEHDGRFTRWPGIHVLVKPLSAITIARGIHAVLGAGH